MPRELKHGKRRIDADKLTRILEAKGLNRASASRGLGRSEGFLKDTLKNGEIAQHVMIALESVYGIRYEDIAPDPEPEPKPVTDAAESLTALAEALTAGTHMTILEPAAEVREELKALTKAVEDLNGVAKAYFTTKLDHERAVETQLRSAANALMELCANAKAESVTRDERALKLEKIVSEALEPDSMYKNVFRPIYNAIRAAQGEDSKADKADGGAGERFAQTQARIDAARRRIDGTPIVTKG